MRNPSRQRVTVSATWLCFSVASAAAADVGAPAGTLIEAESPPPKSTCTVIDDADASGGKAVTTSKDWEPMFFAESSVYPEGDAVTVHVRSRGGAYIVKVRGSDGKQQDLKSVWSSPPGWTWTKLGTFPREKLGEGLTIIRTNKGKPAIDCVVLSAADKAEVKSLPPFEPRPGLTAVSVAITADWSGQGRAITAAHWAVADYGILKPADRHNPAFNAYLNDLKPGVVRIHWSGFPKAWTDEASRGWNVTEIKQAFTEVAPGYGDATLMVNIPHWPEWFHDGPVLPEEKEADFAALCADLVRVMRDDVQRRVEYWEVLNELENRYEKHASLNDLWRLLGKVMTAMREADPAAKFGGPALTWPKPAWVRGYMASLGDQADFVTWHNYATDDAFLPNAQLLAKADTIAGHAADALAIIREMQPGRTVETFLTEYNVSWTWRTRDARMTNNVGAVFHAMVIKRMAEVGVTGAMVWHIKDGIYGLLDAEGNRRPPATLFLWGRHLTGQLVPVRVQVSGVASDTDTPVEVLAVRGDNDRRTVLLINRSEHPTTLDLAPLQLPSDVVLERIDASGVHRASTATTTLQLPGWSLALLRPAD